LFLVFVTFSFFPDKNEMASPILFTNDLSPHGNIVKDFLAAAGLYEKVCLKRGKKIISFCKKKTTRLG
jgi:hypothetical protein